MTPAKVDVLTPDDGQGGVEMSTGVNVDADTTERILEEELQTHQALMSEVRGNAASAHSVLRHSGARKFNQEDPIEAAAAEMILQRNA